MSFMFEVYHHAPSDREREKRISKEAGRFGGELTCREEPDYEHSQAMCLTYEFNDLDSAERAAEALRALGEHVEGPCDYGPP
jgi:hypothetical protein